MAAKWLKWYVMIDLRAENIIMLLEMCVLRFFGVFPFREWQKWPKIGVKPPKSFKDDSESTLVGTKHQQLMVST